MKRFCAAGKDITKDGKTYVVCDERRAQMLPLLQKKQEEKGYISDADMQNIADELGVHPVEIFSIVTFYSFFTDKKKGKNVIRVANCISNRMKNSLNVIKAFEKRLGIKLGETTSDGLFTLEKTSCIGMCDHAPAIMVNDKLIGDIDISKVEEIVSRLYQENKESEHA